MVNLQKRDKIKITTLIFIDIISFMPLLTFLIFEYLHYGFYFSGLLTGDTRLRIDASNNNLVIIGNDFRGIHTINLASVVLLFVSVILFLIISILLIRECLIYRKSEKENSPLGMV